MSQIKPARKASPSVVANVLCSIFKVSRTSDLEEVLDALDQMDTNIPWLPSSIRLFPTESNVVQDLQTPKKGPMSPLLVELVSFPGEVYLVRDSKRSSADGLWCVVSENFHSVDTLNHVALSANCDFFVNRAEDERGNSYRIISILVKTLR